MSSSRASALADPSASVALIRDLSMPIRSTQSQLLVGGQLRRDDGGAPPDPPLVVGVGQLGVRRVAPVGALERPARLEGRGRGVVVLLDVADGDLRPCRPHICDDPLQVSLRDASTLDRGYARDVLRRQALGEALGRRARVGAIRRARAEERRQHRRAAQQGDRPSAKHSSHVGLSRNGVRLSPDAEEAVKQVPVPRSMNDNQCPLTRTHERPRHPFPKVHRGRRWVLRSVSGRPAPRSPSPSAEQRRSEAS
jgi:hypothetical protein